MRASRADCTQLNGEEALMYDPKSDDFLRQATMPMRSSEGFALG